MAGQALTPKLSATSDVRARNFLLMAQITSERARLGQAIRARRKALDIEPADLVMRLHVSGKTLERWERGETSGAMQNIGKVAEVLETTPAELMAGPPSNGATPDVMGALSGTPIEVREALRQLQQQLSDLDELVDQLLKDPEASNDDQLDDSRPLSEPPPIAEDPREPPSDEEEPQPQAE